jgi:hypothetical protein
MASIYDFELKGAKFSAIKENGAIWVPIAPLCAELKIDPSGQIERINRDEILREGARIIRVPFTSGGPQRLNCLPLRFLAYWLLGVSFKHITDDDIRANVLAFKREAVDVLFAYFMPDYAAVMGVTLPTFEARLVHQDLFDRADAQHQQATIPCPKAVCEPDFVRNIEDTKTAAVDTGKRVQAVQVTCLEIQKELGGIVNRRPASSENSDIYKHIVKTHYCGLCPCCQKPDRPILDPDGTPIEKVYCEDHVTDNPRRNALHEMWPVCRACNTKFSKIGFRDKKMNAFYVFQSHIREYVGLQGLPLA